jgi:hypothetical protein
MKIGNTRQSSHKQVKRLCKKKEKHTIGSGWEKIDRREK